jgi:hypothetical protein
MADDRATLQELVDRQAVIEALHRFADGIDRRDWVRYRAAFTDEIELDYSSYRPENSGTWTADAWVDKARSLFPGLDASQHSITNAIVELDGDIAHVVADVRADHVVVVDGVTRVYTVAGWYDDELVRTSDGWRIRAKALHMRWAEGDASVMQVARDRVRTATDGGTMGR